MDKIVNPFFVSERFIAYCIEQKWLKLEFDAEKKIHYYLTEEGERELTVRYHMDFDMPCARVSDEIG